MEIVFDNIEVIKKRVRAQDPVSSVQAAERSARFANSHKGRILFALECLCSGTAREIGDSSGLSVVQVDRRLIELQRDKLIEVPQLDGNDLMRDGYRVWRLVKKISPEAQQSVAAQT